MGLASKKEAEMKPTPRSARLGAIADALMAARDFANKAKVPEAVPLLGGQGLGSLVLGKAPEELTEMSYGNMPMRINPLAGRTASYVPEMKPGRKEQVADLALLAGTPKVGKAGLGLAGGVDDASRAAIAFHGTPHKFAPEPELPLGRFRSEKIGSGEGAQAYGYGTYFAEDPKVGKQYMTEVSSSMDARLLFPLRNQKGVLEAQLEADKVVRRGENNLTAVERSEIYKQIKEIDKQLELLKPTITPSVYKVDIPDEMVGKMLDWDKPLKDQPKTVQEALKKLPQDIKEHIGIDKYNDLKGGPDIVKPLGGLIGDAKASEMLRQAGIPGIRYLDEVSRKKGEGTRNIVVFPGEEDKVKILKRDGNETKMAKGGMMNRSIPGFQDGGNAVEPTTGNAVPIGSLPNEVADDIPARLSEGEFVLPSDVVRFIGLERLMKMRDEAKAGLQRMAEIGQMGNAEAVGEKADDSFEEDDDEGFESTIDDIMSEMDTDEQTQQAFAKGGAVGGPPWLTGYDMKKAPKNPVFDVRYFKHSDGRMMYVTFFNGKPMTPIPDGFTETEGPVEQQVGKEAEEEKKETPAPAPALPDTPSAEDVGAQPATTSSTTSMPGTFLGFTPMQVEKGAEMLGKVPTIATKALSFLGKNLSNTLAQEATAASMQAVQAEAEAQAPSSPASMGGMAASNAAVAAADASIAAGHSNAASIAAANAAASAINNGASPSEAAAAGATAAAATDAGVSIGGQPGMEGISDVGGPGVSAGADSGVGPGVGDAVSGVTGDDGVGVYAKGGMVNRRKQPAKKQKKKGLASR